MIEIERKRRLLRSAFSNGLDFLDGMYAINSNKLKQEEVEELASDVDAMVEWYFTYLQNKETIMTENSFLKQWKDDVVNSLAKYDANSIEEVYQYGNIRGNIEMLNGAKMLFKLSMSEKPNRTINECEAMIIFRNLEKQIKEQNHE